MDYELSDQQIEIAALARRLAQEKMKPVREHYDKTEEFPWPVMEEMAKADLMGVYLPEKYGGLGGGLLDLLIVGEEFSKVCSGITMGYATSTLFALPVLIFGTPAQRAKWLPDMASGKKLGAFNITEPGAGSDATSMRATAKLDGDHYVLNGTKNFCSTGKDAQNYIVFASVNLSRGARGVSAFIVEKGTPGFSFGKKEQKMGIRANGTYDLVFKDCRIPRENLLYKEGYGLAIAQATFDMSRPLVGIQSLGIAQGALEETLAYIRVRKQFNQTIASFQAIQHMLADCATQIEAGRALIYATAKALDRGMAPAVAQGLAEDTIVYDVMRAMDVKRWTKESGMCKVYGSDVAMKVTIDCIQMCGGIGYMRDFPVEKYFRDAKITQIYEGTNQIQRNEIAMMMIKELASKGKAA
jgi:alkylation response protein AidB-like acyl-CoA dehydrogenase